MNLDAQLTLSKHSLCNLPWLFTTEEPTVEVKGEVNVTAWRRSNPSPSPNPHSCEHQITLVPHGMVYSNWEHADLFWVFHCLPLPWDCLRGQGPSHSTPEEHPYDTLKAELIKRKRLRAMQAPALARWRRARWPKTHPALLPYYSHLPHLKMPPNCQEDAERLLLYTKLRVNDTVKEEVTGIVRIIDMSELEYLTCSRETVYLLHV